MIINTSVCWVTEEHTRSWEINIWTTSNHSYLVCVAKMASYLLYRLKKNMLIFFFCVREECLLRRASWVKINQPKYWAHSESRREEVFSLFANSGLVGLFSARLLLLFMVWDRLRITLSGLVVAWPYARAYALHAGFMDQYWLVGVYALLAQC
jgi:hypothetical protein